MKTLWLVENSLHEEEFYERFKKAFAESNADEYQLIDYYINPVEQARITRLVLEKEEDCESEWLIVPYGCIDYLKWFVKLIDGGYQDDMPFTNVTFGAFFNLRKLSFQKYSANWGKYLLNQEYAITCYSELIRRKDMFYKWFGGNAEAIFVRPVENDKAFTGRLIYKENFDKDVKHMGCSVEMDYPKDMEVVVASPQNVINEWRFCIHKNRIVSSTLYNVKGLHEEKQGCDNKQAIKLAETIIQEEWSPEDIYVLDICETKDNVSLLEIGSVNSAGWYQMDIESILNAFEEWKKNYLDSIKEE